jgi:hypothetical protein
VYTRYATSRIWTKRTVLVAAMGSRKTKFGRRATAAVPFAHDPNAEAPTWKGFLGDRFSKEEAPFLQEFFGYCLTPDVSHETALWLYGPPGGGRSTLIAGAEAMLGEKAGTLGLRKLERSQFALSKIPGKTLLTATEQPAGRGRVPSRRALSARTLGLREQWPRCRQGW